MYVDVLLGLQWGDEGKGKIVDYLAPNYDIIARFQGGSNAGHTLYYEGKKIVLHNIPSGVLHEHMINVIGNGQVLDPPTFAREIEDINELKINLKDRLKLAKKVHLTLPTHKLLDAAKEQSMGAGKIGSTLKGIGPTYSDKYSRRGLRLGDFLSEDGNAKYEKLKQYHLSVLEKFYQFDVSGLADMETEWKAGIEVLRKYEWIDAEYFFNDQLNAGKTILAEGAQGTLLDIDFGSYPFVTSSNTISGGVSKGMGIAPQRIRNVYGISKAYCTRVGSGPFPTELHNEKGRSWRKAGSEFGATNWRPRPCVVVNDIPALKYAIHLLNGVRLIACLTK
ncbi:UNVERIFIED_CONTAM: hypothetical protein GTU68_042084 [Idotea baltica]|nr:hypothetical protein [Idotea baltica]